jgi:hypothetical protein
MRRVLVAAAAAACAAVVLAPPGGAANECRGIPVCISVPGPWVVVAPGAPAQYLLACPRRRGVVGGLDALATSRAVRVTFDGLLGSPVAPGTTTARDAFFHGVTAGTTRAAFQPYLGCIPAGGGGGRSTTSALVTQPGVPLDRIAVDVKLSSGVARTVSKTCPRGERLVGSWDALAFRTNKPPNLALAPFVSVSRRVVNGRVTARIDASDGLPNEAHAEVQVGLACAR